MTEPSGNFERLLEMVLYRSSVSPLEELLAIRSLVQRLPFSSGLTSDLTHPATVVSNPLCPVRDFSDIALVCLGGIGYSTYMYLPIRVNCDLTSDLARGKLDRP